MAVVSISIDSVRINQPVPFALRDAAGMVLVARGGTIGTEERRQQLIERGVYIDITDADAFKKAVAGKMDSMVRDNARLGLIAKAEDEVDAEAVARNMITQSRARRTDSQATWDGLAVKMATALREPSKSDFLERIDSIDDDLLSLLSGGADAALLSLIYSASTETQKYSARHALLVAVIVELAARQFDAWPVERRVPLRKAAITMNLAMTTLQDQLAMQESATSPYQREQIDKHAKQSAIALGDLGVTDELWLKAVELHHVSPPGPLATMGTAAQLARLIRRADVFAARLSPRKSRHAMTATAAARAAYLDENQQTDEAGTAIIKAAGIYPPGCFVKLATGEIAIVLKRGVRANAPLVASVIGGKGMPLSKPMVRDTRHKANEVTGTAPPHEVKVRLSVTELLQLS
jgi:HD-GYP domain-containing protein (c-di-GMP phosphodiesterase class II)